LTVDGGPHNIRYSVPPRVWRPQAVGGNEPKEVTFLSEVEYGPLAHLYDALNQAARDYGQQVRLIQETLDRWGVGRGARLLDLACATGLHAHRLAAAGHRVVGIDTSIPLLRQACAKANGTSRPSFLCQDMRALGLRAGVFDAVYCLNHTLNYMVTNRDLAGLLAAVWRALRHGGLFIFDFISYLDPSDWQGQWRDTCETADLQVRMTHRYTTDWLKQTCVDRHTYEVRRRGRRTRHQGTDRLRVILVQDLLLHAEMAGLSPVHVCGKWRLDDPVGQTGPVVIARKAREAFTGAHS